MTCEIKVNTGDIFLFDLHTAEVAFFGKGIRIIDTPNKIYQVISLWAVEYIKIIDEKGEVALCVKRS